MLERCWKSGLWIIACTIGAFGLFCPTPISHSVLGCAPAPPAGSRVRILEEQAIIVWDSVSDTEHFIRQANFDTDAKDFGFLVPTPTEPELGEVPQTVFSRLVDMTAPKINFVTKRIARPAADVLPSTSSLPPESAPVQVLQTKSVAGLDAVVLKAEDPEALGKWLTDHGYSFRPELQAWLKAYTDAKWIITAFKLGSGDKNSTAYETLAIRMSFKAERPFYPYREPEDMRSSPKPEGGTRSLKLFVLADQRMSATLGSGETTWIAKTVWAKNIGTKPGILEDMKLPKIPQNSSWWLTEFEDNSSPRNGIDEVFFSPSSNQGTVERPAITREIIQYIDEPLATVSPLIWVLIACAIVALFLLCRVFFQAIQRRDNSGVTSPGKR